MKQKGLKEKVLQDIMNYADGLDGEKLKKHPKLVAAKITVAKPMDDSEKEKMMEKMGGDSCEDMPMHESEEGTEETGIEGLTPEDIQKLLKLIK